LGTLGSRLAVYLLVIDFVFLSLFRMERLTTNRWLTLTWFSWVECGALVFTFELCRTPLSLVISFVVVMVRALVHCYSLWYLADDPHQPRFFGLISLFTGFMLLLVYAGNLAVVFLG
jgi:NADH:ubiquinone oxidoreductase subunit 5 (subunit L)/multisubunit Na+/H+ antiporter MnhA subunit